jgi:hypothetical protein
MGFGTFYTILRCYEVTPLAATCTGWLSPAVFPGLLALAKVIAASTTTTSARDFSAGDFMTARPRFRVPIGAFALQRTSGAARAGPCTMPTGSPRSCDGGHKKASRWSKQNRALARQVAGASNERTELEQ